MKKLLLVLVLICLWGCTQNKNTKTKQDTPQQEMSQQEEKQESERTYGRYSKDDATRNLSGTWKK